MMKQPPLLKFRTATFFCNGWNERCNVNSLPIAVNPAGGMNSYWEMPFRKSAKITIENLGDSELPLYYQIDYSLTDIPDDVGYFHASWRRSNPLQYKDVHTIISGIEAMAIMLDLYCLGSQ